MSFSDWFKKKKITREPPELKDYAATLDGYSMAVMFDWRGVDEKPSLMRHHKTSQCHADGENVFCPFHAPSDNAMKSDDLAFDVERGEVMRLCQHSIPHPDVDVIQWHLIQDEPVSVAHECDGCCGMVTRITCGECEWETLYSFSDHKAGVDETDLIVGHMEADHPELMKLVERWPDGSPVINKAQAADEELYSLRDEEGQA